MFWLAVAFLVWLLAAVAFVFRQTRPYAWPLALAMAGTFPGVFLFQIVAAPVVLAVLIAIRFVANALAPGGMGPTRNPVIIGTSLAVAFTILAFVFGMSVAGFYEGWRTGWLTAKGQNWRDVIRQRWPARVMRAAIKRFAGRNMSGMISYQQAVAAGRLPKLDEPLRFSVGDPKGLTSNSWRVWATASGLYIACRDNFKEAKVSLHTSGRWRMGFTEESLPKIGHLLSPGQNRAWEVWDQPIPSFASVTVAFKLLFQTSELAVKPVQRAGKNWKDTIFVEAAPSGKLTVVTLFLTVGEPNLNHESEPSMKLASYNLGEGRYAQVIAHGENESGYAAKIRDSIKAAKSKMAELGKPLPPDGYAYFLGCQTDGCRFLFGTRILPGRT